MSYAIHNKEKVFQNIDYIKRQLDMLYEENMQFKTTINSNINSYNKLTEYSNNLEDRVKSLEKLNTTMAMEIERLNNLLKETSQTLSEQTTKAITLKSENKRLNNIINELLKVIIQCKDEMSMTTYKDMNNCEKWETKLSGYLDILDKAKNIIGSDKE